MRDAPRTPAAGWSARRDPQFDVADAADAAGWRSALAGEVVHRDCRLNIQGDAPVCPRSLKDVARGSAGHGCAVGGELVSAAEFDIQLVTGVEVYVPVQRAPDRQHAVNDGALPCAPFPVAASQMANVSVTGLLTGKNENAPVLPEGEALLMRANAAV